MFQKAKKTLAKEICDKKYGFSSGDLLKILAVIKKDDIVCEMLSTLTHDPDRFKQFTLQVIAWKVENKHIFSIIYIDCRCIIIFISVIADISCRFFYASIYIIVDFINLFKWF